ncbi:MAG: 30S ribosomal protein S17 [Candidatus Promineifilaceae bacterium]|nr:30S ribosomal protein S17 [Anaerolineaceae bacterium]MCA9897805.1 30S ribosomal protein S17 [Anaerolineales bacterium]MCA9916740.1 30S ribosomal protein S17 [Anaerolineales bacterium]MCB8938028.1 30S ribosomal protein S17 [Ardenticatenaceae bacterium]
MREQRKRLKGVVTSDKMDKTVVVAVTTTKRHPIYGKVLRLVKKYKAHDEANECRIGDRVEIIESQPISRHKRWSVVSVLERAK